MTMYAEKTDISRDDLIRQVRSIGESLIKNAESIVGTEEFLQGVYIQAEISTDGMPSINISRSFLPEKHISDKKGDERS